MPATILARYGYGVSDNPCKVTVMVPVTTLARYGNDASGKICNISLQGQ
jgi:hypothetical protein